MPVHLKYLSISADKMDYNTYISYEPNEKISTSPIILKDKHAFFYPIMFGISIDKYVIVYIASKCNVCMNISKLTEY